VFSTVGKGLSRYRIFWIVHRYASPLNSPTESSITDPLADARFDLISQGRAIAEFVAALILNLDDALEHGFRIAKTPVSL